MTDTILRLYRETGNIRKTAATLHIARHRVEKALDDAGIPRKKRQPKNSSKSICFNCANARADRCAFMGAPMEKTEAALTEMGTEYRAKTVTVGNPKYPKKVRLLTVTKCPKYQEGDIVG